MYHKRTKKLVEVCPQCCKSVNSSANRLVQDTCGHTKCRICLLQESSGCLLCLAEKQTVTLDQSDAETNTTSVSVQTTEDQTQSKVPEVQNRKSVITSLAIQIAEQKQSDTTEPVAHSLLQVDKETCNVIEQSLKKNILFPTDIVKRSTGNFYHLKRVFSQRFFNEDKDKDKKHIACETEEKWTMRNEDTENNAEKKVDVVVGVEGNPPEKVPNWKVPRHIKVQYYCTVHKVSFQQKQNILRHHMTCSLLGGPVESTSDALFPCKICGKTFKIVGKLNRHMRVHTKLTKFKCEKCGKCCIDNYSLKVHERSHTQTKPFQCQYCDKKFSGIHNQKRHEKGHKGEKKLVCNECGFRCITSTELKRHAVTHTNLKPFVCNLCGGKFSLKRILTRHMATHNSNPVRFECPHCGSTFKRKDNLERHVKNSHAEPVLEGTELS